MSSCRKRARWSARRCGRRSFRGASGSRCFACAARATAYRRAPTPSTVLAAGDRLIVEGNVEPLLHAKGNAELKLYAATKFTDESLSGEGLQLAEVALAPSSSLLGRSINQGNLRRTYDVFALALRRRGRAISQKFTSVPLEVGDVLLVQGAPEAIDEVAKSNDFLVANRLEHAMRGREGGCRSEKRLSREFRRRVRDLSDRFARQRA